jgi:DnaK suppressor protein
MKRIEALSKLRQILVKRRDAIRRSLRAELSLMGSNPEDPADDEAYSQVVDVESRELAAIEDALARMREGHYGVCEGCGENISLQRLQALPDATYCIVCQRATERHGAAWLSSAAGYHATSLLEDVA